MSETDRQTTLTFLVVSVSRLAPWRGQMGLGSRPRGGGKRGSGGELPGDTLLLGSLSLTSLESQVCDAS